MVRFRRNPISSLGQAGWHRKIKAIREENIRRTKEYAEQNYRGRQLELPMNAPKAVLCRTCMGRGCKDCGNSGVAVETPIEPATRTEECPRCYGVGKTANARLKVRTCRRCLGKGTVEIDEEVN